MEIINDQISVKQMIECWPQTKSVFIHFGFKKLLEPEVIEKLGPFLKVHTLLKHNNISQSAFLKICNAEVHTVPEMFSPDIIKSKPTFLGLLPCGLKVSLDRAIESFAAHQRSNGNGFDYLVEGNVNHELSYYQYVDSVDSVDELPDLILSSDLNSFFHHRFLNRFVNPGGFVSVNTTMNSLFTGIGYSDPRGNFTMFSANVLVIVHVHDTCTKVVQPQSWKELTNDIYRKSVIMRGQDDFFCSGVLIPYFKLYGVDSIKRLAGSVCGGMHPSQMVKMIDSGAKDIAPLYIMPWFFAKKIKLQDRINIIFPEEGGFISPVQILVKKLKYHQLSKITDYLLSEEMQQHCANNFFPSFHTKITNNLPAGKKIYWIGWDFIYGNDLGRIKKSIGELFTYEYSKSGK